MSAEGKKGGEEGDHRELREEHILEVSEIRLGTQGTGQPQNRVFREVN